MQHYINAKHDYYYLNKGLEKAKGLQKYTFFKVWW